MARVMQRERGPTYILSPCISFATSCLRQVPYVPLCGHLLRSRWCFITELSQEKQWQEECKERKGRVSIPSLSIPLVATCLRKVLRAGWLHIYLQMYETRTFVSVSSVQELFSPCTHFFSSYSNNLFNFPNKNLNFFPNLLQIFQVFYITH